MFEVMTAAESVTAPHLRTAPLQKHYLQKVCGSVKKLRGDEYGNIGAGDVYVASDGGNHGPAYTASVLHSMSELVEMQ